MGNEINQEARSRLTELLGTPRNTNIETPLEKRREWHTPRHYVEWDEVIDNLMSKKMAASTRNFLASLKYYYMRYGELTQGQQVAIAKFMR